MAALVKLNVLKGIFSQTSAKNRVLLVLPANINMCLVVSIVRARPRGTVRVKMERKRLLAHLDTVNPLHAKRSAFVAQQEDLLTRRARMAAPAPRQGMRVMQSAWARSHAPLAFTRRFRARQSAESVHLVSTSQKRVAPSASVHLEATSLTPITHSRSHADWESLLLESAPCNAAHALSVCSQTPSQVIIVRVALLASTKMRKAQRYVKRAQVAALPTNSERHGANTVMLVTTWLMAQPEPACLAQSVTTSVSEVKLPVPSALREASLTPLVLRVVWSVLASPTQLELAHMQSA